ncbi:MAG: hypothetical protein EBT59_13475, partial [Betaproteobacteria bacterium]|nr:hypothetical protein [Betaproteobacteria bacterium]
RRVSNCIHQPSRYRSIPTESRGRGTFKYEPVTSLDELEKADALRAKFRLDRCIADISESQNSEKVAGRIYTNRVCANLARCKVKAWNTYLHAVASISPSIAAIGRA